MRIKDADFPKRFPPGARRWARVAVWFAGLYIIMLVVLLAGEDRLAFAGWTFRKAWVGPPSGTVVEDAMITAPDGNIIQAWWLPPADWTPAQGALVYMHGNGENLSNCGHALKKWRDELHLGVLGFDYPGYGHSTGTPSEQSCYAAAQAALDWIVREKKVAPENVTLVGQSLGGAMAIELGCRQRCRMVVTSGAFTSFPEIAQHRFFWIPAFYLVHLRFDNLSKMRELKTPMFITHGTADRSVPFSYGERLYAAVGSEPKRFYATPGHGHSQPDSAAFYEAVRGFLKETRREEVARAEE
jgi:fermentation-respiration switch protein FrsA (DUF1100 family)